MAPLSGAHPHRLDLLHRLGDGGLSIWPVRAHLAAIATLGSNHPSRRGLRPRDPPPCVAHHGNLAALLPRGSTCPFGQFGAPFVSPKLWAFSVWAFGASQRVSGGLTPRAQNAPLSPRANARTYRPAGRFLGKRLSPFSDDFPGSSNQSGRRWPAESGRAGVSPPSGRVFVGLICFLAFVVVAYFFGLPVLTWRR